MARRSQSSSAGENPLDPNYLPPHYREEYRLAIDALVEEDLKGYYQFLQKADVVDFLSSPEIHYIQSSVQVPQQSNYPEQCFLDTAVDGSSDTYWPIHSDLDAPGLDLGWPQLHHFIGPTEVTTLVNPPEPDMPSIKEQARRLIKNANQVVAIVMDLFTDVDMFADILDAAMRNVAVYILLDKQNAHHFVNMVSNCRVNIQGIQFLRVRTVSGITYHCRSGKSFNGQMMDRFLLTDCRAVLSGNYSFMWSFEKLHRCMAHLFLGQLVSTFDEEFRILFAQSQPLIIENVPAPVEDFSLLQEKQFPSEIPSLYREPRTFLSVDSGHPEEWPRHSYDEYMDWKMMPLKRQESVHGPAAMYSRFPSQQSHMDPPLDQGPSRMLMMENPAFKRNSYADGIHGRYSYPFQQQQGMPEPENQGRQFHRGQQPYPATGKDADYNRYDKFWSQGYQSADPYSEPGLPQEMEPPYNFDSVHNYLSSTRNVDFEQGSEKLPPAADSPFSSSHPRRLNLGQPYACQTSPTPSNPADQKQFLQEPNTDRKDPMVKQGLRNWRISSYLSAYDNPGDEGLPLAPLNAPDPLEEPSNLIQKTAPGIDLSVPKIPNVREFKVPAIPRASQMPSYAKTTAREQTKKLPDEPIAVASETKTTPTPSESSSTTEGEKTEEAEQKEPKSAVLQRDESFRRKHNAAVPRSSRLRSSLIFSSLEQQHHQDTQTAPRQQDEESDKNEEEQTKLPFVFQVLGQRRSTAREPFEWSRYIKPATFDNSAADSSKQDDGNMKADDKDSSKDDNSKDLSENREATPELANSSPSVPQSKPSEAEMPKTDQPAQPPKSLLTSPLYVDMSDPDKRLMFFKELAAKRKSAKAAEAEKSKERSPVKTPTELKCNTTVKKEEPVPKETSERMTNTLKSEGLLKRNSAVEDAVSKEECQSISLSLDGTDKTNKEDSQVKNNPNTPKSFKDKQTRASIESEKIELKNSQLAATLPGSAETEAPQSNLPQQPKLSSPAVKQNCPSHPPTPTNAANVPSLAQETDESESPCFYFTSKHSSSLTPSSAEVAQSSAFAVLDFKIPNTETVNLEPSIPSSPQLSEQHPRSEFSSSHPSVQSSSSDHILPDSGSQISPSPSPSSFAPFATTAETRSSNVTQEDSSTTYSISQTESTQAQLDSVSQLTSSETSSAIDSANNVTQEDSTATFSILSPNVQASVSPSPPEPPQSIDKTSQKSTASSLSQTESTQAYLDCVFQLTSPETPSAVDSASNVTPEDSNSTPTFSILSPNVQDSVSPSPPEPPQSVENTSQTSTQDQLYSVSQLTSSETPSAVDSALIVTPEDSNSTTTFSILPPNVQDSVNPSSTEVPQSVEKTSQKPTASSMSQTESTQARIDCVFQLTSPETPSAVDSASNVTPEDSNSTPTFSILSPNVQDSVSPSPPEPPQSVENTSQTSTQDQLYSVSQLTSSETPSAVDSALIVTPEDSNSTTTFSILPPNVQDSVSPSSTEVPQSVEKTSQKPTASSMSQTESTEAHLDCVSQLTSSETSSAIYPASNVTPEDSISTPTFSILSPNVQDSISPSPPEPPQSVEEISQKSSKTESTQAHLDSVSQLMSSNTPSAVSSAHVQYDISYDTYAAGSEPNTLSLCPPIPSEKDVSKSEHYYIPKGMGEDSEVLRSLKFVKADSTPPCLSLSLPESCLPNVSDLEIKSRSDQNEIITPNPSPADHPLEHSPAESSSPINPAFTPNTSQSETTTSPQDASIQATPPSEFYLTRPVTPTPAETISCSPQHESVGSVMSPEAGKTLSALHSPSDINFLPKQVTRDENPQNKTSVLPSTKISCPTEPKESNLPCIKPVSVDSETHHSESPVSAENSKMDSQNKINKDPEMPDPGEIKTDDTEATNEDNKPRTQELVCSEKTTDQVTQNNRSKLPEITSLDQGIDPSPQSKQPKSSQSRYHSSTANVLSSSNLRDDTKLLLEQISANSQSRNEATKESPVTDDEKEDKADKNAKREKERGIRSLSRGQPKSDQEREKLLERIESMRKERKVYSRFEMAP